MIDQYLHNREHANQVFNLGFSLNKKSSNIETGSRPLSLCGRVGTSQHQELRPISLEIYQSYSYLMQRIFCYNSISFHQIITNFAHVTTAGLSWHVQEFVMIIVLLMANIMLPGKFWLPMNGIVIEMALWLVGRVFLITVSGNLPQKGSVSHINISADQGWEKMVVIL